MVKMLCRWPDWWLRWPWHERCAFLVGQRLRGQVVVRSVIPCRNTSKLRTKTFSVTTADYENIEQRVRNAGLEVVGVVHSHPGQEEPEPSNADIRGLPEGWVGAVWTRGGVCFYTREGAIP